MAADARGSRREFETLLEPILSPLHATAVRLSRSRTDAEDLVQEAVMKAWKSFGTFERGTNFKAWCFRILTNTFISGKRSDKRTIKASPLLEGSDVAEELSQESFSADEWNKIYPALVDDDLKRALDELPDDFRVPVLLSSLGELSYKEMASALDVPIGTIMSRIFRGRERLRAALKDYARERGIVAAPTPGRES